MMYQRSPAEGIFAKFRERVGARCQHPKLMAAVIPASHLPGATPDASTSIGFTELGEEPLLPETAGTLTADY